MEGIAQGVVDKDNTKGFRAVKDSLVRVEPLVIGQARTLRD